jgi:uncharacterized protein YbbK (DUF523 family)
MHKTSRTPPIFPAWDRSAPVCISAPGAYHLSVTAKSPVLGSGPVIVSACLAGRACRFDGSSNQDDEVGRLVAEGRAILVCPEEDGGLSTPRPPAEIVGGDGTDVLAGRAQVMTRDGRDVTAAYLGGANHALAEARRTGASAAVLKARSPSCGKGCVYDGSFTRTTRDGDGVTAALLQSEGIAVVTDEEI